MAGLFRVLYVQRHHNDPDLFSHLDVITLWLQLELTLAICLSCTPTIKLFVCSILLGRKRKHSESYYATYLNSNSNSGSNPSKNSRNLEATVDEGGNIRGSQRKSKIIAMRNQMEGEEEPELEEIELVPVSTGLGDRAEVTGRISIEESSSGTTSRVEADEIRVDNPH